MDYKFNEKQKEILNTLLYSDVFNYPLAEDELWLDLSDRMKIDKDELKSILYSLSGTISFKKGYYCISGREKIIDQRIGRSAYSLSKFILARNVAKYLAYIPTVLFIGVTGRLAHNDAYENDDIDIIIITKKNSIWATRLLVLSILELMNVRRLPGDVNAKDKICPNLILEESALGLFTEKQDIYTAHEITHICPLFDRENLGEKFINSNKWVFNYYPNRRGYKVKSENSILPESYFIIKIACSFLCLPFMEYFFEKIQRMYMAKKITNETILSNFLAFHPFDYRSYALKKYKSRLKKYKLIIDK